MFKLLSKGLAASFISLFMIAPAFANDTGVASILHSLRSEKGHVCMVGHFHHGKSRAMTNKKKALKAAVRHWSSFTALEYGTDWGTFSKAANRSVNCQKATASQWVCKVKGRPCRRGLSVAGR